MGNIKILVAEDDENILSGLTDVLESEDYKVFPAKDGKEAIKLFGEGKYDLVLLDVMMPEMNGYDVCKHIRQTDEDVPVIMLTAKSEEIDKVVGLKLGADDYITKPFGIHELLARISAILRRTMRGKESSKAQGNVDNFDFGIAKVNTLRFEATLAGDTFELSEREVDILKLFYTHPNEVLKRDFILNEIWGVNYYGTTRTLDQHIAQLRKKVEKDPSSPEYLKTVHGTGYKYLKA
ncbi:MAG: response regulator transcription factor [Desulfobacterales bacterium]|nr:response regulator transcription factor [Desulfobacterales bacterium]MCP4159552.1 response regulator transcription factor [Deltaproteobacteria bacterium]